MVRQVAGSDSETEREGAEVGDEVWKLNYNAQFGQSKTSDGKAGECRGGTGAGAGAEAGIEEQ